MLPISELNLGFADAENYKRREFKDLFNNLFVRDASVKNILDPEMSFLLGEKGTGKTAYAVYLTNNFQFNTFSNLNYIRETEYQKFVSMKKKNHLDLTDYTNIWKVIIYLLISKQILEREASILNTFFKFGKLNEAIDDFYMGAFSPEIINALEFAQNSKSVAEIFYKFFKIGNESQIQRSFSESRFQINLMYIQKHFELCLSDLKLSFNHVLFIDGIDIRPHSIEYNDYLDCVKGLANAVWQLNNDFFPSIKDSKGRLKVVLLLRPDIFVSLGLQNQNTKIRSNSVFLDWRTTYDSYFTSHIFSMIDRILSIQQKNEFPSLGDAWNAYFPYRAETTGAGGAKDSSFVNFLRFSLYRPRDIITMISILQDNVVESGELQRTQFSAKDFDHPSFRKKLADYLLGEIKDQISFYYTNDEYKIFVSYFEFLDGRTRFNYDEYVNSYEEYMIFLEKSSKIPPGFMSSHNDFLQFLYELNIISYIQDAEDHKPFIHWCFRDRSYSNISPSVKKGVRYEIFYGLAKAINAGKRLRKPTIR